MDVIEGRITFPATRVGESVTYTITVENQGNAPLTITGVSIKDIRRVDYALAGDCVTTLAPSAACTLSLTFAPTKDGRNLGALAIESDATGGASGRPGPRRGGTTFTWLTALGYGACADAPFASGSGTSDDPYVIRTIDEFNCISATTNAGWRSYLDKAFVLANDLDGHGVEGAIRPVGNYDDPFTGSFDGGGHTIRGFSIDDVWAGLFPYLGDGASVHDLVIEDADVKTVFEGGILSYYTQNATVTDVVIKGGSLEGSAGNANGGLIGYGWFGSVTRVTSSASVSVTSREGFSDVGGLIGVADQMSISESAATGPVSVTFVSPPDGVPKAGGFAGAVWGSTIRDSYATGAVTIVNSAASTFFGGFIGSLEMGGDPAVVSPSIQRAYATGAVTNTGAGTTGGFLGRTYQSGASVLNSVFWDSDTSLQSDGRGTGDALDPEPEGRTSAQMRSLENYAGWDIAQAPARTGTWTLPDSGPPVLTWSLPASITPGSQTVTATVGTPITPTAELSAVGLTGATSYAVEPALPSGLSLDASTGVISGTPTATSASTVHTITARGATSGSATATVTVSVTAVTSPSTSGPAAASTPTDSSPSSPAAVVTAIVPASTTPVKGTPSTATPLTQLPVGITRLSVDDLGAPRVIRSLSTTIADAPKVTAKAGTAVNVAVRGLVPGASYEVRMRTGKGAFSSLGTKVARSDGSMRLPAWSSRKGVRATIAIIGPDGPTSYLKVDVVAQDRSARARR